MRSTHRSRARAHNHAANHKNCCDREVTINRIHIPWYFRSRGFLIGHTAPGFPSAPVSFPVLAKLQRRRRRRRRRRPCVSAPASPSTWPPSATSVHSVPLPARHSATLHQARPPSLLLQPQQDNHRHLAPPPQATHPSPKVQRFPRARSHSVRHPIRLQTSHRRRLASHSLQLLHPGRQRAPPSPPLHTQRATAASRRHSSLLFLPPRHLLHRHRRFHHRQRLLRKRVL